MAKILLIEDDKDLTIMITNWLQSERHTVEVAYDGNDGLQRLRLGQFDVIVLDWALPEMSGIDILKTFRKEYHGETPIIMLTGRTSIQEKEEGLDCGADDYLTKPFNMKELSARIRALLRRPAPVSSNVLKVGGLTCDPGKYRVTRDGVEITLLPREFALLEFLMRHPDEVFSGEALLSRVWSTDSEATADTVRTNIMRLRQKIDKKDKDSIIETIPRVGYRMKSG